MTYTEDDLTEGLIEHFQSREFVRIIEPEAHYDHYGKQGWPDLYVVFERPEERLTEFHLIEVKSESAVKQATGANEIIRQFNQMRYYFYKDERRHVDLPHMKIRKQFSSSNWRSYHLNTLFYICSTTRNCITKRSLRVS